MELEEKKQLENNIWKIYLYSILTGAFFSVPVVVIFWQKNGLSIQDIMILQSLFAIAIVALEIPSGYFADKYGRKKSLIITGIAMAVGILSYSLAHNFLGFLIGELFFATAVSFQSGAMSAFVFDTLKNLNRENEYQEVWGRVLFYGLISIAVAGIIGGFIAKINLRLTLFSSIPFFILLIPLAFSLIEPKREKNIIQKKYLKKLVKSIKKYFFEDNAKAKKLKWIIIYSAVIYAFNQSVLWLYQPYFNLSGLNIVYFGIVFASFQVISALTSRYAHKLERILGEKYSFIMLIFLVAVSFLLMSNFVFLFSFSFSFIQQFVRGYKNVIISDYINKLVGSEMRATVLSIESFFSRLLYASIIPVIGWMVDIYSLTQALMMVGVMALVIGFVFLISFRINKVF